MSKDEILTTWVRQAQARDAEAFGWLVQQFQDMAVGYAASILGDFHLAEDAAQEAFLEAWRDLPRLREPAAFAGWLRKIVFKQCDRMRRGKRIPFLPLETAGAVVSHQPGPAELVERHEMREAVRHAIQSLPERERHVTVLFYIGEYSQHEIAVFLGVAVITVKKRLAAARQRLKERMIALMQEDLQAQRPSRNQTFAERVLTFSQQFREMIDAGNSLVRCFTDLADRQDDPEFKNVLARINQEIQAGQTLSRSMAQYPQYFDERYVKAVKLGEITGTLEFQLQRLAAGHAFDFGDLDSLETFRPESPSVIYSAEWALRHAIRDGITEIHLVRYQPSRRMHRELAVVTDRIDLINGVTQRCVRSTVPWITDPQNSPSAGAVERYQSSLPSALYGRYKQMAGIDAANGEGEGHIDLQDEDGKEYEIPVTLHRTPIGETLVIAIRAKAQPQR